MKRTSKELKRMAKETLLHNFNVPMGAFFVSSLITTAIEILFSLSMSDNPTLLPYIISLLASYLISLLASVLTVGQLLIHLNLVRGKESKISQVFTYFKHNPERYIGAEFLMSLLIFSCMIPFFLGTAYFYFTDVTLTSVLIVGITSIISILLVTYFSLIYGMSDYFLIEYPQMKITASFRESRLLLKGNLGRFFYLNLSFLGWSLVVVLTLGVAALFIQPYMTQTFTRFYLDLTGELDRIEDAAATKNEKNQPSVFL